MVKVTPSQRRFLLAVAGSHGWDWARLRDIAESAGLSCGAANEHLHRLQRAGLAEKSAAGWRLSASLGFTASGEVCSVVAIPPGKEAAA